MFSFIVSGCAQTHAAKGWSYIGNDHPELAIKEFKESGVSEKLPGYYSGLYVAYRVKYGFKRAKHFLDDGLEQYPNDFQLNMLKAQYLLRYEVNPDEAIRLYEKCKTLTEHPSTVNPDLKEALRVKNDISQFKITQQKAIEIAQECL